MIYNKLVRDKIPEICRANGQTPVTALLDADGGNGFTMEQLLDCKAAKKAKRGGFEKRIFLKEVIE